MIQLFTDSAANLPAKRLQVHEIQVVPFSYCMDGECMECGQSSEFDGKAYYNAMRSGVKVTTSTINLGTFLDAFEPYLKKGTDILYIGMSGGISGTAGTAAIAMNELQAKYPERKIACIDTYAASLGEGLLVLKAAEQIKEGALFEEIAMEICEARETMCQYFTVDDLNYLRNTGRISGVASFVGNVLNIKPILKGDEIGRIVLDRKVQGKKKALSALTERYAALCMDKGAVIGIAHADDEPGAACLLEKLREAGFHGECITVCYEPVTGSHVGPGTVALFFAGTEK